MQRTIQRLTVIPGANTVHGAVAIAAQAADGTAISGPSLDLNCPDQGVLDKANDLLTAYSDWLAGEEAKKPADKQVPVAAAADLVAAPIVPGPTDAASGLAAGMVPK